MKIFKDAQLKLTFWYVLLIMIISVVFSFFIYASVIKVSNQAFMNNRIRLEKRFNELEGFQKFRNARELFQLYEVEAKQEVRVRTLTALGFINLGILVLTSLFGYLLAGKNLAPIKLMIEKQKKFFSEAAHELKTPITSLKTGLEVSLRSKDLTLVEAKETMSSSLEDIDKLSQLVNVLLASSKYSTIEPNPPEKVDISELLLNVISEVAFAAKTNNLTISTEVIPNASIVGYPQSLRVLFRNIIDNAIKYSPRSSKIIITLVSTSKLVKLTVTDSGKGFSSQELERAFEPFYRGAEVRSSIPGHGLGLSICKDIMDMHHGKIWLENADVGGARVVVQFNR